MAGHGCEHAGAGRRRAERAGRPPPDLRGPRGHRPELCRQPAERSRRLDGPHRPLPAGRLLLQGLLQAEGRLETVGALYPPQGRPRRGEHRRRITAISTRSICSPTSRSSAAARPGMAAALEAAQGRRRGHPHRRERGTRRLPDLRALRCGAGNVARAGGGVDGCSPCRRQHPRDDRRHLQRPVLRQLAGAGEGHAPLQAARQIGGDRHRLARAARRVPPQRSAGRDDGLGRAAPDPPLWRPAGPPRRRADGQLRRLRRGAGSRRCGRPAPGGRRSAQRHRHLARPSPRSTTSACPSSPAAPCRR